ncbi:MAG: OmpH family outer membrane protein [Flavobacteriales bacterium]|tara:strand:+ start:7959 stop:8471 length:513 start_codon:yes stop_codon:yes gene_type:complete
MKVFKIVILMVVVALSTSVTAQKDAKIGHINSNDLLSAMPERTAVQKNLEEYAGQLKVTLDAMRKEYETKVGEFQAKQEVMTDIIKDNKIKEITDLEKRIGEFQQTAEADLQKKEQALLQPIIDKAKTAIDGVARENGYTYILDSSVGVVLYSVEGDDILPKVKTKLGIN